MTYRLGKLGTLLMLLALSGALAQGCSDPTTGGDNSETHFLSECSDDDECGGLECLCGVCTSRCSDAVGCGKLAADASCEDSCTATAASKICDVACSEDQECGGLGLGFSCRSGRCRSGSATEPGSGGAGGQGPVAPQGGAGPSLGNCQADADPTPELLPNAELDPEVIARAAAVAGSCMPDDGVDRNATHLWHATIASPRSYHLKVKQARCLADARCGCAAVVQCLGYEVISGVAADCTSGCDGDVFVACGEEYDVAPGYAVTLDCAKLGQSCDEVAICSDSAGVACDGSEPSQCRDGAPPLYCDDGALQQGPDCAALGLGCADGVCQGTGATCTNVSFPTEGVVGYEGVACNAGTLEACVNGRIASVDCATRGPGFDCQSVDGVPFCGLASDCLPAGDGSGSPTPPSCQGASLTFCNAGRLDTVDCLSLGFTGCTVDRSAGLYGCTPTPTAVF